MSNNKEQKNEEKGGPPPRGYTLEYHVAEMKGEKDTYAILGNKPLGEGASGIVWRVRGRKIPVAALKIVTLTNDTARERFKREVLVLRKLDHPNICRIFDSSMVDDQHGMVVLEYLNGHDLQAHIDALRKSGTKLSLRDALTVIDAVLRALSYCHSSETEIDGVVVPGIIHRDLKPSNIFLVGKRITPDSVKLIDFGIAKPLHHLVTDLTVQGGVLGTLLYISPEQVDPKKFEGVDGRCDLYAAGTILYELLCGGLPYGIGNHSTILDILDVRAVHPRTLVNFGDVERCMPRELFAWLQRVLQPYPRDRFASAAEAVEALERAVGVHYLMDVSCDDLPSVSGMSPPNNDGKSVRSSVHDAELHTNGDSVSGTPLKELVEGQKKDAGKYTFGDTCDVLLRPSVPISSANSSSHDCETSDGRCAVKPVPGILPPLSIAMESIPLVDPKCHSENLSAGGRINGGGVVEANDAGVTDGEQALPIEEGPVPSRALDSSDSSDFQAPAERFRLRVVGWWRSLEISLSKFSRRNVLVVIVCASLFVMLLSVIVYRVFVVSRHSVESIPRFSVPPPVHDRRLSFPSVRGHDVRPRIRDVVPAAILGLRTLWRREGRDAYPSVFSVSGSGSPRIVLLGIRDGREILLEGIGHGVRCSYRSPKKMVVTAAAWVPIKKAFGLALWGVTGLVRLEFILPVQSRRGACAVSSPSLALGYQKENIPALRLWSVLGTQGSPDALFVLLGNPFIGQSGVRRVERVFECSLGPTTQKGCSPTSFPVRSTQTSGILVGNSVVSYKGRQLAVGSGENKRALSFVHDDALVDGEIDLILSSGCHDSVLLIRTKDAKSIYRYQVAEFVNVPPPPVR